MATGSAGPTGLFRNDLEPYAYVTRYLLPSTVFVNAFILGPLGDDNEFHISLRDKESTLP